MGEALSRLDSYDARVTRIRGRLWWGLMWRYGCRGALVWLLLWAAGVLMIRLLADEAMWGVGVWGAVGVVPVLLAGWYFARKRVPSLACLQAYLEARSAGGGLYLAAQEYELGGWAGRLPEPVEMRMRLTDYRWPSAAGAGLVFLAAAWLIPVRYFDEALAWSPLQVDTELEQLAEQIDTLEEEEVITVEEQAILEQSLKEVERLAEMGEAGETWEAIDTLKQQLQQEAERAGAEALQRTETATAIETVARALAEHRDELSSSQFQAGLDELNRQLQEALKADPELLSKLDASVLKELGQSMENLKACCGNLEQLAGLMESEKKELAETLARLCEASMLDPEKMGQCKSLGECNSESLAAFLQAGMGGKEGLKACMAGSCPGQGGVSRGRGDAAMAWTDAVNEEDVTFKEQTLSSVMQGDLGQTKLMGVSVGKPSDDPTDEAVMSGALKGSAAGESGAVTITVLPKHQAVLERYFVPDGDD